MLHGPNVERQEMVIIIVLKGLNVTSAKMLLRDIF